MKMKALVTGGSGYFGALLRDKLIASGYEVSIFDLVDVDDRPRDVQFFGGDICDLPAVQKAVDGADVVFHCVAQVPLAKDKELFERVNYDGTINLLESCHKAGTKKLVIVSSSAVFGVPKSNPVTELTEPSPIEDYGKAKHRAEVASMSFAQKTGLDVTVVRPRTILGHGRLGIFEILFDWIADGKDVYVLGSGDNLYQFVHADDLAEACILASKRPGSTIYNVGAENFTTMRKSLEGLVAHAKTGSGVRSLPMGLTAFAMKALSLLGLAPFAPYHWIMYGKEMYFDVSKAKSELGWKANYSNVAMMCHSYDWYLQNREQIKLAKGLSPHRSAVRQGLLKLVKKMS